MSNPDPSTTTADLRGLLREEAQRERAAMTPTDDERPAPTKHGYARGKRQAQERITVLEMERDEALAREADAKMKLAEATDFDLGRACGLRDAAQRLTNEATDDERTADTGQDDDGYSKAENLERIAHAVERIASSLETFEEASVKAAIETLEAAENAEPAEMTDDEFQLAANGHTTAAVKSALMAMVALYELRLPPAVAGLENPRMVEVAWADNSSPAFKRWMADNSPPPPLTPEMTCAPGRLLNALSGCRSCGLEVDQCELGEMGYR